MLDAADTLQGAHFNFLHGYYRVALAELRVALELVMIGTFGSLQPNDANMPRGKKASTTGVSVGDDPRGEALLKREIVEALTWYDRATAI